MVFQNGQDLIDHYSSDFDLLFVDIEVPGMNGLKVSEQVRIVSESFLFGREPTFIGRTSNYDTRLARYNDGWQLIPRIGAWGAGDCDSIVRGAS